MPERVPAELEIEITAAGVIHLVAKGLTAPRAIAVMICNRQRWDAPEIARRLAVGFDGRED